MIVVHAAGESHADWFGDRATELVDFSLWQDVAAGVYRVPDADALARSALERTIPSFESWTPVSRENDWPDLLAAALRRDTTLAIGDWSAAYGLRPETVSRGFLQAYGVSPARYRLGLRIKGAVNSLANGTGPLADIAFEHGFADQAHMTRAVRAGTGRTPGQLRAVKSVQEGEAAAL